MSHNVGVTSTYPGPVGRTAQRLEWVHLPPKVRAAVEARLGRPVVEATSQTSGFTPGFASVLVTDDGARHFVKAASLKAQRMFAQSYREEARKLGALPPSTPAPGLRWSFEAEDWFVLGIEHVQAHAPVRPWREADVAACLDMLAHVATILTPPPPGLRLDTFAAEFADWPAFWDYLRATFVLPRGEEAAALAARFADATAGDTVVHTDVRDDNLLLTADGSVLLCDWNWPVVGAAWIDSLLLLIGPRGDGVDVEAIIATHPTFTDVPAESIDILLALVTGYFLKSGDDPVPATSPHIRGHQRWQGDVCWEWLCARRGWEPQ